MMGERTFMMVTGIAMVIGWILYIVWWVSFTQSEMIRGIVLLGILVVGIALGYYGYENAA